MSTRRESPPSISELYPDLSPEQQREAERNLRGFAEALFWNFFELAQDEDALRRLGLLTDSEAAPTVKKCSKF